VKILMLSTQHGSPDGARVHVYREGEEYDLSSTPGERDLAAVFVREGWAATDEQSPTTKPKARRK
jgi:hypothetical protein